VIIRAGLDGRPRRRVLEVPQRSSPRRRSTTPAAVRRQSGSPDTVSRWRSAASILQGDDFLTPNKAGERFEIYREQAGAAGRSAEEAETAVADSWVMQKVFVAATREEAREFARPYLEWRHHKALELQPPGAAPTMATKLRAKVPGLKSVLNAPHLKDDNEITGDDLLQFGVFGTPDDCIERLREFETAGVRNILCSFTYGGMPAENVRQTMRLFATRRPRSGGRQSMVTGRTATARTSSAAEAGAGDRRCRAPALNYIRSCAWRRSRST
jgi:alkanesulfonate monooxygenase SsuD/methylene tetrahydromethanopterin reductase-like flavin-dependent oxidoreductase (luciferase family)